MSSPVLELQQALLSSDCDILSALRKAHVIAVKLKLSEFDEWIQCELNGYENPSDCRIPSYRKVKGVLKGNSPYGVLIPVVIPNDEVENNLCSGNLFHSIGELLEIHRQSKTGFFLCEFSASRTAEIIQLADAPIVTSFALHIPTHLLQTICENIKNELLEWTLQLEREGILGEGLSFTQEEKALAKEASQQNNYYGTVINGDVNRLQVVSGNHNTTTINYNEVATALEEVKQSLEAEQIDDEAKQDALELLAEISAKIEAKKRPAIITATLGSLRDFLIASGAGVTAALITQGLMGL